MYRITIKNFYRSGRIVKEETTLYTVPIEEDQIENVLTEPSVTCDLGKTGTFEFTIHPNHPYYHALAQMRTIMRVEYDGDTIFRGRVLTIDNTMAGAKKVHCEGDMAFLLDSFQIGSKKETRDEITLQNYIISLLNEHNRQMMETEENYSNGQATSSAVSSGKEIYPGYIPGAYPDSISSAQRIDNVIDQFGSNSTEQTMNALEALIKEFGGFFRTRYSAKDNKTYLDWCKLWFREDAENCQPIAIGQNIIDVQSNSEVNNIFTALIPIGSDKGQDLFINGYKTNIHGDNNRILVPQITKVYTDDQLSNGYVNKDIYAKAIEQYGVIYKTQKFPNADTQEKLWSYACDWIKNNYVGGITSYDLSAIDMHHVDDRVVKYLVGDCIYLTIHSDMTELDEYNPDKNSNTVRRTLLGVKYNLHNPDKDRYTAGIPSDILNLEYGTASTSKSGKGGAGGKGGGNHNNGDDREREREAAEKANNALAWKLVWDETHNNDKYNALKEKYGWQMNEPALNTSQVTVYRVLTDPQVKTQQDVASIVMEGEKVRLSLMDPGNNGYNRLKQSPAFSKYPQLVDMIDKSREAMTSVTMDASLKAFSLKGKNNDVVDEVASRIENIQLPEDATAEDYRKAIENNLAGINMPKDVFKVATSKDALGNEAGILQMAKESVVNMSLNSAGNDGKGTADVGKQNGQWLIKMNEPLQYRLEGESTVRTVPNGTIDAADFSLLTTLGDPIPSVNAQLGVFRTVIAEHADILDLKADAATVNNLSATVANIQSVVAKCLTTDTLNAGWTMSGTFISTGLMSINGGATLSIAGTLRYHNNTISLRGIRVVTNATTGDTTEITYLGA